MMMMSCLMLSDGKFLWFNETFSFFEFKRESIFSVFCVFSELV
jgi:hypothetical protein